MGTTAPYAGACKSDFIGEFGGANNNELSASILTASVSYLGLKPVPFTIGYTDVFASFAEAVSSADISFNKRPAISHITNSIAGSDPRAAFAVIPNGDRWYTAGHPTGSQDRPDANHEPACAVAHPRDLPVQS